ncbi:MAG: cobalamin B12-binding domain-containing protein [Candidatus Dormibacteraeota bacterium]|nr:cobalamin B12-binding domain-containing protein [Candidatus Dormibacteraeota bacterium]MBO0762201.1 cobalamin B12-binding domain-containing protein [Candidatus Dormibacteraeota bacterium]
MLNRDRELSEVRRAPTTSAARARVQPPPLVLRRPPSGGHRGRPRRPPVPALVDALLDGERTHARQVVHEYLTQSRSRTAVISDLLQPALLRLSELWYEGRLSASDEAGAAGGIMAMARALPATPSSHPIPPGRYCLLAVLGEDPHTWGVELLARALADDGWEVEVASGLSVTDVQGRIVEDRPRFVGLSAGHLPSPHQIGAVIRLGDLHGVPVLVGGPAFNRSPELWRQLGAQGQGHDARLGVVLARRYTSPARAGAGRASAPPRSE